MTEPGFADSPVGHPSDGVLLALQDGERDGTLDADRAHMQACAACQARLSAIANHAAIVRQSLSSITVPPLDADALRRRLAARRATSCRSALASSSVCRGRRADRRGGSGGGKPASTLDHRAHEGSGNHGRSAVGERTRREPEGVVRIDCVVRRIGPRVHRAPRLVAYRGRPRRSSARPRTRSRRR